VLTTDLWSGFLGGREVELAAQLAAKNIGVSVLCPGFVQTRIHESERNKPQRYGSAATVHSALGTGRENAAQMVQSGIPVEPVGNRPARLSCSVSFTQ
jgi:short-subunit dehydrogenase